MLYGEIIAVCSQIHTKHINRLCGQNVELYIKIQCVPRSKHSVSVTKTSQLMLYREIIAVCSEIHTKHINTLCGQNVDFTKVAFSGTWSRHWALKSYWWTPNVYVHRFDWVGETQSPIFERAEVCCLRRCFVSPHVSVDACGSLNRVHVFCFRQGM